MTIRYPKGTIKTSDGELIEITNVTVDPSFPSSQDVIDASQYYPGSGTPATYQSIAFELIRTYGPKRGPVTDDSEETLWELDLYPDADS